MNTENTKILTTYQQHAPSQDLGPVSCVHLKLIMFRGSPLSHFPHQKRKLIAGNKPSGRAGRARWYMAANGHS